jgi:hypothetical protein
MDNGRVPSSADHEEGLALFISHVHRARFRDSLENNKLRAKLRRRLAHFEDWLDPSHVKYIPTSSPQEMADVLRLKGAGTACHVVSEDADLDGSTMPLEAALMAVLHDDYGALVSCVPGRLARYSGEAPNQTTALLERTE